jgi:putative CRISPR-associated protein (TIGR02619 family)
MGSFVVSTCGTSILTDIEKETPRERENEISVVSLSNKRKTELTAAEKNYLDGLFEALRERSMTWDVVTAKRCSAEINALLTYYGDRASNGSDNRHCFVHSDTYVGEECAKTLMEWCQDQGLASELKKISGLNTADYLSFNAAMSDLAKWCAEDVSPWRENKYQVVFNLTGGFKSLQGFMQTLGMFYADDSFYLFEGSSELMHIPRLPINIDSSALDEIEKNFEKYRTLSLRIPMDPAALVGISGSMIFQCEDGGQCILSAWGQIFWDAFKKDRYPERFYGTPLPEKIILNPSFIRDVNGFRNDENAIFSINERLDDLARFLLSEQKNDKNIKRLDFKAIAGDLKLETKCDYEFDAWSSGGAGRVFCRFIDDTKLELVHLKLHKKE